jgi:hypothetical protein
MVIARNVRYVCSSKTLGLSNGVQFFSVLTSLVSKGKRMFRIKPIFHNNSTGQDLISKVRGHSDEQEISHFH